MKLPERVVQRNLQEECPQIQTDINNCTEYFCSHSGKMLSIYQQNTHVPEYLIDCPPPFDMLDSWTTIICLEYYSDDVMNAKYYDLSCTLNAPLSGLPLVTFRVKGSKLTNEGVQVSNITQN